MLKFQFWWNKYYMCNQIVSITFSQRNGVQIVVVFVHLVARILLPEWQRLNIAPRHDLMWNVLGVVVVQCIRWLHSFIHIVHRSKSLRLIWNCIPAFSNSIAVAGRIYSQGLVTLHGLSCYVLWDNSGLIHIPCQHQARLVSSRAQRMRVLVLFAWYTL